ncbi:recombinase family protein (plasmid) [Rhodococcus sp. D-6]|uniref:Recombinase family protein n=1 Tax=Rhodococcus sp. D-6 TaxID=1387842 RepID=A0AAU7V5C0_9NOCA
MSATAAVVKGMEEKVRGGGTPTRAPIGYLNVRALVNGQETRHVEIDTDRAEHVRWAFKTYAEDPDITIATLTDMLNDRGLTIRATANQAERPLQRSHVHRMLTNRYYLGFVTWRGVEYPGNHQPMIDEPVFSAVQNRLAGNRAGGNRERKHRHYLSGSLFCGRCGSRMVYSRSRGRGGRYEYFVCTGHHTKANDCDAPYISIDRIEAAVETLWKHELQPWQTSALPQIRAGLIEHLSAIRTSAGESTTTLQRRIEKVRRDRYKWAERAMEGAVPTDIAREKQEALARQLANLEGELQALERAGIDTEATLTAVLDLIADPALAYHQLIDEDRRRYNQAWFSRIYIDITEDPPNDQATATGERTVFGAALEASRELVEETLNDKTPDPYRSGAVAHLGVVDVMGSNRNPLVELLGAALLARCRRRLR